MRKNAELYGSIAPGPSAFTSAGAPAGTTGSYGAPPPSAAAAAAAARASRAAAPLLPACKPEVLSPAGGWPQLRAAVQSGADAVYFGLSDFNARARAANFAPDELGDVMAYLRSRGVKGYVALNVLVFDEELPRLEARARQIAAAGVDAVIVQVGRGHGRGGSGGRVCLWGREL